MKPQTAVKARTVTAQQSDSSKLVVLNTLVLLGGLVVLIMSIQIVSGF
jgi:hypothetical protein